MQSGFSTPPSTQNSAKKQGLDSYESPPSSRIMNRHPSDEELEFLRRATVKNDRPAHLKALHEEAA